MKNILVVFGTRPEAIKLAPLIIELQRRPGINVFVCNTEQQKQLSNQTIGFFGIKADIKLDIMRENQDLSTTQARIVTKLHAVLSEHQVDAIIVQGDTLSVFCGAFCGFCHKIPVFHVEAGLRSYNMHEPFPEEGIRQMVSRIADLHFAPTEESVAALRQENISPDKIVMTGNTVIDALNCLSAESMTAAAASFRKYGISSDGKNVLVTVHRRENHGERLICILDAIEVLIHQYSDYHFIFSVHPNPNVQDKVMEKFKQCSNVSLFPPLDYPELVFLMKESRMILTDSGGIQEEAPTYGVPLVVLRYKTERMEGVKAGFAKLVGANKQEIIKEAQRILDGTQQRISVPNPYGDGCASVRIADKIVDFFKLQS